MDCYFRFAWFLSVGQNVQIIGENINKTINNAIADAYNEYFLRKSILNNPIERINTNNNIPALIHTNIVDGDEITITVIATGFEQEERKPGIGVESLVSNTWNKKINSIPTSTDNKDNGGDLDIPTFLRNKR